jgi:hypothetical protein
MNETTKVLLSNVLAAVGVVALSVLVALGKLESEALLAFLGGLLLRPGVPPAAKQD